jgi:hypothetical protein
LEAEYLNGVLITESKKNPESGLPFSEGERMRHSRMGIITELGELIDIYKKHIYYGKDISIEHLIEEYGDACWYLGLGFNVCEIIAANPDMEIIHAVSIPVILENAMHVVTDDTIAFEDRLMYVFRCMITCIKMQGLDYQEILDKNLVKLRKRYGDSFDADRAINRNTAAEYAAMKGE